MSLVSDEQRRVLNQQEALQLRLRRRDGYAGPRQADGARFTGRRG